MSLWVLLHGVGSLSVMKVFKRKLSGHLVEILERGFKHQLLLWLLFSGPIMSDSSCRASLSLTISRVCSSSCPLHQWCYPAISSSDALFSFCLQSFSASGSFPMNWLFSSGDQNIGASASALVLPMSEYSGLISFRIDWFDLLAVKGTHKSLLQAPQFKGINSSVLCIRYCAALTTTHDYWKYYCAELNYLQWLCQSEVLGKGWQIRSAKYVFNQLIMSTHALDWKEFWSHVQFLQEKCLWSIS